MLVPCRPPHLRSGRHRRATLPDTTETSNDHDQDRPPARWKRSSRRSARPGTAATTRRWRPGSCRWPSSSSTPRTSSAGSTVLDIATGTGNAALAAARAGGVVTGIDFAPGLLERARTRAAAEGLDLDPHGGRCRGAPVRGRLLRRGRLRRRRDVHARPAPSGRRAAPGRPARRDDRARQLDPGGLRRRDAPNGGPARAAARRDPVAPPLGHRGGPRRAARRRRLRAPRPQADLRVPLPLGRGLRRPSSARTTAPSTRRSRRSTRTGRRASRPTSTTSRRRPTARPGRRWPCRRSTWR